MCHRRKNQFRELKAWPLVDWPVCRSCTSRSRREAAGFGAAADSGLSDKASLADAAAAAAAAAVKAFCL